MNGRPGLEAVLVLIVIAIAAALTRLLPLPPVADQPAWSATFGALRMQGELRPARVGMNSLSLTLMDTEGQALAGARIVAQFLPVGGGAVIAQRELAETAPGHYSAGGFALTRAGPWQTLFTLQRPGQPIAYVPVDWDVGPDGGFKPVGAPTTMLAQAVGLLNQYGGPVLSGLALACVAGWSWRAWRGLAPERRRSVAWYVVPGLLLAALFWYLIALWNL